MLCFDISYESAYGYDGFDPVLVNNLNCITVADYDVIFDEFDWPNIGITENTNTLTVFPNPTSTHIRVDNAANALISVYNIAGQEVLSHKTAETNQILNVSDLKEGICLVRVVKGNEVSTAKVSIVR